MGRRPENEHKYADDMAEALCRELKETIRRHHYKIVDGIKSTLEQSSTPLPGYVSKPEDGTDRLCRAMYDRQPVMKDYIGGSEARMLHDAANRITKLQLELNVAKNALKQIQEPEHYDVTALHGAAKYFRCVAVYAMQQLSNNTKSDNQNARPERTLCSDPGTN